MSRQPARDSSTIPITLDPSIYRPQAPAAPAAPARSATADQGKRRRSITLAPAVYEPSASRTRGATGQHRPTRSKDLPPIPKSPWPVPKTHADRSDEDLPRRPRREANRRIPDESASERAHSAPPSRQGTFYKESSPERRAFSNPPSRKGTMNIAPPPRRPAIFQENPPPRAAPTPNPVSSSSRSTTFDSKPASSSSPPSRSSTLVEDQQQPLPLFKPSGRGNNFQTRYMNMLLSLDTIPRLHNILASFFGWVMLAGFIVFPSTFTSLAKLQDNSVVQQTPGAADVLDTVQSLPLLVVAAVCCGIGYLGNLWLSLRWRNNYVWLLNRLYLPGTLNALAGLISTLTNIFSQHGGSWSVSAKIAVVVESVTLVFYLALFILYNNWLLEKVKEQHARELDGGGFDNNRTFKGKVEKMAKQPSVAPGSVV